MPKSDLLAVAFTDLNGNHKYNPGKDTLIAAVVDTNNDNKVSVGDTIQWGTYPKIPDGSASGTGGRYNSPDTTVTGLGVVNDTAVVVDTDHGQVTWEHSSQIEIFQTNDFDIFSGVESNLFDLTSPRANGLLDVVFADPGQPGPGRPNVFVDVNANQPGDQGFLDVFIGHTHHVVGFSGNDRIDIHVADLNGNLIGGVLNTTNGGAVAGGDATIPFVFRSGTKVDTAGGAFNIIDIITPVHGAGQQLVQWYASAFGGGNIAVNIAANNVVVAFYDVDHQRAVYVVDSGVAFGKMFGADHPVGFLGVVGMSQDTFLSDPTAFVHFV